jgi:hypothetical protein
MGDSKLLSPPVLTCLLLIFGGILWSMTRFDRTRSLIASFSCVPSETSATETAQEPYRKFLGPSICVVGRSSPSHIPDGLAAFSFSLSSAPYKHILQFIIPCEFPPEAERRTRDVIQSINRIGGESTVFLVLRNESITKSYSVPDITDYCYVETDLLMQKLLHATWNDLTTGEIVWPLLEKESLPVLSNFTLCDYFLFTNTDNLYGREFLPRVWKAMRVKAVRKQHRYNKENTKILIFGLLGYDWRRFCFTLWKGRVGDGWKRYRETHTDTQTHKQTQMKRHRRV